mmetsp:Transcript_33490/g.97503  ORF Transcript_33490/g.97503 Transcript_33490/m.97503 type:complete len:444 (-) Transcript_33490:826-2157(-)
MLRAHDSALHENTCHNIHDAEQDDTQVYDEKGRIHPTEFGQWVVHLLPRHAAGDNHKQGHEAPGECTVGPSEIVDELGRIADRVLKVCDRLAKQDAEEVHDEEQNQQGAHQGLHRRHQRESHLLELTHCPDGLGHTDGAQQPHKANRPKRAACQIDLEGQHGDVGDEAGDHEESVQQIPPPVVSPEEVAAVHTKPHEQLEREDNIEGNVPFIEHTIGANAVARGSLRFNANKDCVCEDHKCNEKLVFGVPDEERHDSTCGTKVAFRRRDGFRELALQGYTNRRTVGWARRVCKFFHIDAEASASATFLARHRLAAVTWVARLEGRSVGHQTVPPSLSVAGASAVCVQLVAEYVSVRESAQLESDSGASNRLRASGDPPGAATQGLVRRQVAAVDRPVRHVYKGPERRPVGRDFRRLLVHQQGVHLFGDLAHQTACLPHGRRCC